MRRSRRGFAVVLMVALLAAIVLLLVALSALTRGELRRTAQQSAAARARDNAMVGLRVALGRLQEAAGPDACSTAQARFVGATANPFWTGVWRDSVGPLWLVSGHPADANTVVTTNGAMADGAILVGENTAGVAGVAAAPWEQIVAADWPGRTGVTATGRFAFWVGDEGVKGNVRIPDHVAEVPIPMWPAADDPVCDPSSRARLRQLVAHRAGTDALNFGDPPTSGFLLGSESDPGSGPRWAALERVLTPAQLRFVAPAAGAAQFRAFLVGHHHDLTTCSLGLLVDAARGGLRGNLSDLSSPEVSAAVRDLERYRPVGGRLPICAGHAAGGEAAFQIKPILTEWSLDVLPYREDGGERLLLGARVRLEFWNPFALPLEQTGFLVRLRGLPVVRITGPSGMVGQVALDSVLGPAGEVAIEVPGEIGGGEVVVVERIVAQAWPTGLTVEDPTPDDAGDDVLRVESVPGAGRRLRLELLTGAGELLTDHVGFPSEEFVRTSAPGGWSVAANLPFPGDDAVARLGVSYHWRLDPARASWADWIDPPAPLPPVPSLKSAEQAFSDGAWRTPDPDPVERARRCGEAFAATDLFAVGGAGALFDFPVQRNLSVAVLSMVDPSVGRPAAGAANDVFDRAFFNPVSASWRAGDRLPLTRHQIVETPDLPGPTVASLGGWGAARHLGVAGMFNVNSVSPAAWTVILGRAIPGWTDASGNVSDLENPFFIWPHSSQFVARGPTGRRVFTDATIQRLAGSISDRVGKRSQPFRSLAEFVDSGLLESAIEEAGLNTTAAGWADLGAAPERCSPDWLSQRAMLNTLAPILTVRSDTFTIRVAAEALNPALPASDPDHVAARAWCEAVVQRFPEFVDGGEAADSWPVSVAANVSLGRRFRVVSFRWLGPDDL